MTELFDRTAPAATAPDTNGPPLRDDTLNLVADVLVLGGGPAGTWAAYAAAASGARVVLADKGYCGTSGATAPSGVGVWYVPPDPAQREFARASRESMGGYLSERSWMDRVLDQTYASVGELAAWGYPFPLDDDGQQARRSLQGPEYMKLMRKKVKAAGVTILDHSPALELLADEHGVAGAAGVRRQSGERWRVSASAVVIATGGCAFLSKALGSNVLTGDGTLMAAEAGAEMSGMEFSNAYGLAPAFASVTKSAFYRWGTFYHEDGTVIEGAGSAKGRSVIAQTLMNEQVYCILDRASEDMRAQLRASQPNFFLPFDRVGIDPLTQRFPVTLRLEGTVRGTGGIRIADQDCSTTVPGLYAAGDASTRELICGGFTGGGSHNAAWAISSGNWAGRGAASFALRLGARFSTQLSGQAHVAQLRARQLRPLGQAALRPSESRKLDPHALVRDVQAEVFPFERNLFRTERGLSDSLARLHSLWRETRASAPEASTREVLRGREAAAMLANARFMYETARHRTESRGMHKHLDYPSSDRRQQRRLVAGGLDNIWVRPEQPTERDSLQPEAAQ